MNAKRKLGVMILAIVLAALVVSPIQAQEGWPAPILDGVLSGNELVGAIRIPTGELPLQVWAASIGDEETYFAMYKGGVFGPTSVLTEEMAPDSFFVVFDDGDGEFYEAGDSMVLCEAGACSLCSYSAAYTYDCAESLPGAMGEVAEVMVPSGVVGGQAVFGYIEGDEEQTAEPFDFGEIGFFEDFLGTLRDWIIWGSGRKP
jgi:hypothetical protein